MTITGFHAHVYYANQDQQRQALLIREKIGSLIPKASLGQMRQTAVVFHPLPMFQISIATSNFAQLVSWLMLNRGALSILVHPLTGDPWLEHTEQALWLGEPLTLDLDVLRTHST